MNHIISVICCDYNDLSKATGSADVLLTVDGKLPIFSVKDKFNLNSVERIVVVDGIENRVMIPFDVASGHSHDAFSNVQSLKITGELKDSGSVNIRLEAGQVLSVSINQSKLMKKYLTPVGTSSSTPVEETFSPVDLSSLGLELEPQMFYKNSTARPCIILDVQRRTEEPTLNEPPPITVVLITGFDGNQLCEVMAEEEFKRVIPIYPTPEQPGTVNALHTSPEWMPHPHHQIPSYVLCIPIKVYPQNLRRFDDMFKLDDQNLNKLQMHLIALGGIIANADFEDLDIDYEDDDELEVTSGDTKPIVRWEEIVM